MAEVPHIADDFANAKAWPFVEARALIERLEKMQANVDKSRPVLFETGYGPSGLPHIGTFGEVVRTSMVRYAFERLTSLPTKFICFSDDMDGLRKVPDNIPNKEMVEKHLGKPLTEVPDPFGTHDSFGAHNNAMLKSFLDGFGFEYEFFSATECYKNGDFDKALLKVLENYEAISDVILPTLGEERRATYSPFLPICPDTREVLQVEVTGHDSKAGTITYRNQNKEHETSVLGGACKLQWKCDWAMRWYALGVDYEMAGKDLSESVIISSKIIRMMGGVPPVGMSYELFLDQDGQKISKSKGNGLSVEEWLAYGTQESLALFMYNQPRRAKRLFFDVIPKTVDEYYSHLNSFSAADSETQLENPVWHIHESEPPSAEMPLSFTLLLNLAGVCQAENPEIIWSYLKQYQSSITPKKYPHLTTLVERAVAYYQERIRPHKNYRLPNSEECEHLKQLDKALADLPQADSEAIQSAVFATGKGAGYEPLRDWFLCLYQVLLGQDEGPRMGSFIHLYGIAETRQLIADAIEGKLAQGEEL